MLRTRTGALLAELHAHTTWSDGSLPLPGLVDLYGSRGFDVLCVTDSSSSTGRSSSHGSRGSACPASRVETSTGSSTSTAGSSVIPCGRDEEAVVRHLRSHRPVFITQVGVAAERAAA
jgi:predicted metal-dependent phosphoesterase TrpH